MNVSTRCTTMVLSAALTLLSTSPAWACGESKFRAGHGLKYSAYKATVPGAVLVMAPSNRALIPRVLKRAGHNVVVVNSPVAVRQAMLSDRFDVIVVPYEATEDVGHMPMLEYSFYVLPMVKARDNLAAAKDRYGAAITTVSGGREIIGLVNAMVEQS